MKYDETYSYKRIEMGIKSFVYHTEIDKAIGAGTTNVDVLLRPIVLNAIFRVKTCIAGNDLKEITHKYPANWKEAFKERWFPQWMKNIWPVEYTKVTLSAAELYPKISLPKESHIIRLEKRINGYESF